MEHYSILYLYCTIFLKYWYLSTDYFDTQFILSNLLMGILTWINFDNINNEMRETGKFISHSIFISICLSLIGNFIFFIYSIIFYFGFVNTIILTNIFGMCLLSEFFIKIKNYLINHLLKYKWIFEPFYCLSKYIWIPELINNYSNIFTQYVWPNCIVVLKALFDHFMKINKYLSDNKESKIVKDKISKKYYDTMEYIIFYNIRSSFASPKFQNMPTILPYKNNLPPIDINMSFLKNTNLDDDDLDDLDEDINLENFPVPEKNIEPQPITEKILTSIEKKAALGRKIAEKRNARTMGNRNKKMAQEQMGNIMNLPGMNKIFETISTDENMDQILRQVGNTDPNQLMNILTSMDKKLKK